MDGKKVDRRTKYTKRALRDSIIKLLREKPVDKITVKELCETADINRSTFYAYYGSPADLMHRIERELLRDLEAYLADASSGEGARAMSNRIAILFEYVAQNADVCMTILGEHGSVQFQRELMALIQNTGILMAENTGDGEKLEYLIKFIVSGSVGVVQKWFEGGMRKTPRDTAEMLIDFIYFGLSPHGGAN
ncbi:MAG: TetR/AcrR family transcriptional regulator [Oscillospiraceae bacterium]|jgi:AcrR family transcriptional regulator|nr:TetR/AcrR family transcriptional regulator [Oscillospiraceae bacterium]